MKSKLDIDNWERKDHFNFFRQFEEPFFGLCITIDCTTAYTFCKEAGASFFLYYLHKSLVAANKTAPFRYRVDGDEVIVYETVNASPTINRANGTFGFAYMDYHEDLNAFIAGAQREIDRVKSSTGLVPAIAGENVIHYSSIPWINFTSLSHARAFSFKDSCPKVSFGMMTEESGKKTMPVSIHAHHALMDGYHVAQFIDLFQQLMSDKQGM